MCVIDGLVLLISFISLPLELASLQQGCCYVGGVALGCCAPILAGMGGSDQGFLCSPEGDEQVFLHSSLDAEDSAAPAQSHPALLCPPRGVRQPRFNHRDVPSSHQGKQKGKSLLV